MPFECNLCSKKFASQFSLGRHNKKFHEGKIFSIGTISCTDCELKLKNHADLCRHLRDQHGANLTIQQKTFDNENEFIAWRTNVEKAGRFVFRNRYGVNKQKKQYFRCFRSGYYKSTSKGMFVIST